MEWDWIIWRWSYQDIRPELDLKPFSSFWWYIVEHKKEEAKTTWKQSPFSIGLYLIVEVFFSDWFLFLLSLSSIFQSCHRDVYTRYRYGIKSVSSPIEFVRRELYTCTTSYSVAFSINRTRFFVVISYWDDYTSLTQQHPTLVFWRQFDWLALVVGHGLIIIHGAHSCVDNQK